MSQLKRKVEQKRMLKDAKRFIQASGEFRTVPDLAKLLQVDTRKLNQLLNAWRDCGKIFSIPGGSEGELFPLFTLDRSRGPWVIEAVPEVLQIFGDKLSPSAIAGWFIASCNEISHS